MDQGKTINLEDQEIPTTFFDPEDLVKCETCGGSHKTKNHNKLVNKRSWKRSKNSRQNRRRTYVVKAKIQDDQKTRGEDDARREVFCWRCGKQGHFQRDCQVPYSGNIGEAPSGRDAFGSPDEEDQGREDTYEMSIGGLFQNKRRNFEFPLNEVTHDGIVSFEYRWNTSMDFTANCARALKYTGHKVLEYGAEIAEVATFLYPGLFWGPAKFVAKLMYPVARSMGLVFQVVPNVRYFFESFVHYDAQNTIVGEFGSGKPYYKGQQKFMQYLHNFFFGVVRTVLYDKDTWVMWFKRLVAAVCVWFIIRRYFILFVSPAGRDRPQAWMEIEMGESDRPVQEEDLRTDSQKRVDMKHLDPVEVPVSITYKIKRDAPSMLLGLANKLIGVVEMVLAHTIPTPLPRLPTTWQFLYENMSMNVPGTHTDYDIHEGYTTVMNISYEAASQASTFRNTKIDSDNYTNWTKLSESFAFLNSIQFDRSGWTEDINKNTHIVAYLISLWYKWQRKDISFPLNPNKDVT